MYDPAQDMWPFDRVSGLREWGDDSGLPTPAPGFIQKTGNCTELQLQTTRRLSQELVNILGRTIKPYKNMSAETGSCLRPALAVARRWRCLGRLQP